MARTSGRAAAHPIIGCLHSQPPPDHPHAPPLLLDRGRRRRHPPRRDGDRRRRRGPGERGGFRLRRRQGVDRDRELHDPARPRPGLHADPARRGQAARPADDGGGQLDAARHRLHRAGGPRHRPHRHHRRRAGDDDRRDPRPREQADRLRAARPPLSAGGEGGGRAPPGRPHRGGRRPRAAGRPASRPACSARSSTSRATAPTATRCFALAREAPPRDHLDRAADPAPPHPREARGADRRGRPADEVGPLPRRSPTA